MAFLKKNLEQITWVELPHSFIMILKIRVYIKIKIKNKLFHP